MTDPKQRSILHTAATTYREAGLCALPARLAGKRPAVSKWKAFQSRLPTSKEIDAWFSNEQDAVCIVAGAVSGNLELIDFDRGGELYDDWSQKIPRALLAKLVIETSQSGGRHVVYRCETEVGGNLKLSQRCCNGEIITLIETRGEGGLFLCSPTPGYELVQGDLADMPVISADERETLLLAAWELNEYWAQPSSEPANYPVIPDSSTGSVRPGDDFNERGDVVALLTKHGWRSSGIRSDGNQHWTRPGKSHGTSATLKDGTFYVFSSNAHPFEPNNAYSPFGVFTLLEHAGDYESAARELGQQGYGQSSPVDASVELSAILTTSSEPEEATAPAMADPGPLPDELLRVPGFISEVMDYCIENAPTRNPAMAFCGALALQSFLGGRKVRDPADNRTNIYLLALAPTGSGKDYPRKINKIVLSHVGMGSSSVLRFASGEGIQDALFLSPSMMFQTDEIDSMLLQIKGARDGRYESLMDRLKEIYTSADQSITTRCLAKTQSVEVHQPSLTLLGTAVPIHYYSALSEKMLTDGFFSRTICVEAIAEVEDQDPHIVELPNRVLETATWWSQFSPMPGNLANHNPSPAIVPMTDEAQESIREVRQLAREKQNAANDGGRAVESAIWSRVRQMTHKLALIHAISSNHCDPRIGTRCVTWARDFTLHQARRMLFMASGHVSNSEFDADCKKAIRILTDWQGKHGVDAVIVPWRFRQRMSLHPQRFKDVMYELEQRQQAHLVTVPGKTKPSLGYKLK